MAPRKHYAKGQEIVYRRLGTSARPKFKAVYAKVPVPNIPTAIPNSGSEPSGPPIVDPPQEGDDQSHFAPDEASSFLDYEIPQKKKKVRFISPERVTGE